VCESKALEALEVLSPDHHVEIVYVVMALGWCVEAVCASGCSLCSESMNCSFYKVSIPANLTERAILEVL
jgi:hypothetical protein